MHLLAENAPDNLLGKTFSADCEGLIANANAAGLLRTILKDDGALTSLFNIGPVEECVSAFSLLVSLLQRISDPSDQSSAATEVAEAIGNGERFDPHKRIAMLAALYNLRADGVERCRLLAMIVRLSAASVPQMLMEGQPIGDMMDADSLAKLMDFWSVPVSERRKLYRIAVDGVGSLEGSQKRKQRLLLLFLESYSGAVSIMEFH